MFRYGKRLARWYTIPILFLRILLLSDLDNLDVSVALIDIILDISIYFEQLMQDVTKDDNEIFSEALRMYYPDIDIIPDTQEAVNQMLWFYRCGKELKENKESKKKSEEIYSFEHDSDYIYSAFLDQYKTDLQEIKYLHWWKFKAMFSSLKEDNVSTSTVCLYSSFPCFYR
jgi:hypothetical protein